MNRLLILLLLLLPVNAWWSADWNYSRTLTPSRSATLLDGHVTVDTVALISAGKLRYDCGDLRIVEDNKPISYYLLGCNTTHTEILFDVDLTSNSYELYYGNPSATKATSTGFLKFYDGFDYNSGSDGSPTWTVQSGSFQVNYTNKSYRYLLNSTSESISTAYEIDGNFSLLAEIIGDAGLTYGYNGTHTFSAYFNGTKMWVKEGLTQRELGGFTNDGINYLRIDLNQNAKIYVNGVQIGSANRSGKKVGVYGYSNNGGNIDEFIVYEPKGVTWSISSEKSRPTLVLEFVGSEAANMRTIIAYLQDKDYTFKYSLDPSTADALVSSNTANLDWGTLRFNSTGYSINNSFVKIDADHFNYTNGRYRIDLEYTTTNQQYKKWHIVQIFKNFQAIKHIVFITANQTGNYSAGIYPWTSCSSYSSISGDKACSSNMHAAAGVFATPQYEICGLHYGKSTPFKIYDNLSVSRKDYARKIFWQSYEGCSPFEQSIELKCGVDYHNCTATNIKPVKYLFYIKAKPGTLGRAEYPSRFACYLNNHPLQNLIDTRILNQGLNDLECYGSGNLSYFKIYISEPFEKTRFFEKPPKTYKINFAGPTSKGKIKGVCGIPVTDHILPHSCSDNNLFIEGDFGEGNQQMYIYSVNENWTHTTTTGGQTLPAVVKQADPPLPPLAGSRDMGVTINPPTHKTIETRKVIYANYTIAEMVITAWKVF